MSAAGASRTVASWAGLLIGAALLALSNVVGGAWLFLHFYAESGELGDKDKYAGLQTAEYRYRDYGRPELILLVDYVDGTDRVAIGLPTLDKQHPRLWTYLNEVDFKGKPFQLSPIGTQLAPHCDQLDVILKSRNVSREIASFLEAKMRCS
ncbi:MAG: hypothetical protein JO218_16030 [Burkholderiales bacterium]|nr:hypothetical protein [Burkholderiales bacterium]